MKNNKERILFLILIPADGMKKKGAHDGVTQIEMNKKRAHDGVGEFRKKVFKGSIFVVSWTQSKEVCARSAFMTCYK